MRVLQHSQQMGRIIIRPLGVLLIVVSLLLLTACGPQKPSSSQTAAPGNTAATATPNATSTNTPSNQPGTGTTAVATATTAPGSGGTVIATNAAATTGCPDTSSVKNTVSAPDVTVSEQNINSTVEAHVGNTVEVRFSANHRWSQPKISQNIVTLQQPAGFISASDHVCIWHFVAKTAGTTQIDFTSRPICKPGEMCSMLVVDEPFTLDIKP